MGRIDITKRNSVSCTCGFYDRYPDPVTMANFHNLTSHGNKYRVYDHHEDQPIKENTNG